MTIDYKVWDFPNVPIRSQLFHVPGVAFDGGFTSGGARILSPEPGGRAVLEMQVAMRVDEWDFPFASWITSKTNGEIFRIQLTRTPQLISHSALDGNPASYPSLEGVLWNDEGILTNGLWDNEEKWDKDGIYFDATSIALEGVTSITLDVGSFGEVIKHGHVIGHNDYSYIVDDIEYDGTIATISVKPPLRKTISVDDMIYIRPYFLGAIANGDQIRSLYEAENMGHVEMAKFIFQEVVLP